MLTSSSRWPKGEAGFLLIVGLLALAGVGLYFWSAEPASIERATVAQDERPSSPLPAGPRRGP